MCKVNFKSNLLLNHLSFIQVIHKCFFPLNNFMCPQYYSTSTMYGSTPVRISLSIQHEISRFLFISIWKKKLFSWFFRMFLPPGFDNNVGLNCSIVYFDLSTAQKSPCISFVLCIIKKMWNILFNQETCCRTFNLFVLFAPNRRTHCKSTVKIRVMVISFDDSNVHFHMPSMLLANGAFIQCSSK